MTNLVYLKNKNGIWFDFKIEPIDDEILLEKAVEELSEDEANFIVYLAEKHHKGDFDEEVQFLMNKYESIMDCFELNIDHEFGEMNGFAEYIEPLSLDLNMITAEKLYNMNNQ